MRTVGLALLVLGAWSTFILGAWVGSRSRRGWPEGTGQRARKRSTTLGTCPTYGMGTKGRAARAIPTPN